jgi:hypothetical protein
MDYVIFSIDNSHDLHAKAKFLHYVDTLRAMDKLQGNMDLAIWYYKGVLEPSFVMLEQDFDEFVRYRGFVDNQESVLHVWDKKMFCELEYLNSTQLDENRCRLHEVSAEEALTSEGFTYRPDLNKYWVMK